jgi:hypothetical protein
MAATKLGMNLKDQFGNMMLILFAGHDTTAHTMTWMTYELARYRLRFVLTSSFPRLVLTPAFPLLKL